MWSLHLCHYSQLHSYAYCASSRMASDQVAASFSLLSYLGFFGGGCFLVCTDVKTLHTLCLLLNAQPHAYTPDLLVSSLPDLFLLVP